MIKTIIMVLSLTVASHISCFSFEGPPPPCNDEPPIQDLEYGPLTQQESALLLETRGVMRLKYRYKPIKERVLEVDQAFRQLRRIPWLQTTRPPSVRLYDDPIAGALCDYDAPEALLLSYSDHEERKVVAGKVMHLAYSLISDARERLSFSSGQTDEYRRKITQLHADLKKNFELSLLPLALEYGVDIDAPHRSDEFGRSLLNIAAEQGDTPFVKELLYLGADPYLDRFPLLSAFLGGHPETVLALLECPRLKIGKRTVARLKDESEYVLHKTGLWEQWTKGKSNLRDKILCAALHYKLELERQRAERDRQTYYILAHYHGDAWKNILGPSR